ncbi:MAG: hypothetical protein J1G38_02165 [Clostridiales bacterium]|nr:hypothetical protein [Clostridiales bacterium]
MKKIVAVFILLLVGVVALSVWFSPFAGTDAKVYDDNVAVSSVDGLCYAQNACVRYDATGELSDMYAALKKLRARIVKTATAGNVTVVYAYSDRVCGENTLLGGEKYNVMAAFRCGDIAIGAPLLQGSY